MKKITKSEKQMKQDKVSDKRRFTARQLAEQFGNGVNYWDPRKIEWDEEYAIQEMRLKDFLEYNTLTRNPRIHAFLCTLLSNLYTRKARELSMKNRQMQAVRRDKIYKRDLSLGNQYAAGSKCNQPFAFLSRVSIAGNCVIETEWWLYHYDLEV